MNGRVLVSVMVPVTEKLMVLPGLRFAWVIA